MNTPLYGKQIDQNEMELKVVSEQYSNLNILDTSSYAYGYNSISKYNDITKYLMAEELNYFANYGAILFEDTSIEHQKIQNDIMNTWIDKFVFLINELKGWFIKKWEDLSNKYNELEASNAEFINKFSKELEQIKNRETINFEGYDLRGLDYYKPEAYTIKDKLDKSILLNSAEDSTFDKAKTFAKKTKDDIVDGVSKIKDKASNMTDKLKKKYGNSKDGKKERKYNISEQINIISNVDRLRFDTNKTFNITIRKLTELESIVASWKDQINDGPVDAEKVKAYIDMIQYNYDALYKVLDEYNNALITRVQQAKAICTVALQQSNNTNQDSDKPEVVLNQRSINDIYDTIE